LQEAGVPVRHIRLLGMGHADANWYNVSGKARKALEEIASVLQTTLKGKSHLSE